MDFDVVATKMPFTKKEFMDSGPAERLEKLKALVEDVCDQVGVVHFDWDSFLKKFEEEGPTKAFLMCHHGLISMATALYYEKQLARLRQSMEILCEEMEQVKIQAKRTFIMGPGGDREDQEQSGGSSRNHPETEGSGVAEVSP